LIRITGNALIFCVFLIVWWLFSAATSPQHFEVVDAIINSWFGKLVLISSLWAVWYHLLGGLRHLIWDRAIGLDLKTAEYLGWAVILGSFLLTIITVVILW
jgi:succinate dehydrogenase / fumarate reductase cytochrome b subunit